MYACEASSFRAINRGRASILTMDRNEVLESIEHVAHQHLNLDDEWHFRRFAELCQSLDRALFLRVQELGKASSNPEVREAADDFTESD